MKVSITLDLESGMTAERIEEFVHELVSEADEHLLDGESVRLINVGQPAMFTMDELEGLLNALGTAARYDEFKLPEARCFKPGVVESLFMKVENNLVDVNS